MENYYNILSVSRFNFSKEKLETRYNQLISAIERDYIVYKDNPEMIIKINELRGKIEEAYIVLSDDEKRKKYVEMLTCKQKEVFQESIEDQDKSFVEKANSKEIKYVEEYSDYSEEYGEKYACRRLYDKNIIKEIKYKIHKTAEDSTIRYEQRLENDIRLVDIRLKGIIAYSMSNGQMYDRLARYEVSTYSLEEKEIKKYTVITPILDMAKINTDEKYKKAVCEELFSEENLMKAKDENYGYLGKLAMEDGETVITYNKRDFSASVKFDRELRKDVDRKNASKGYER